MHFEEEQWERIKMFAKLADIEPEKFVQRAVETVCWTIIAELGPEGFRMLLDAQKAKAGRGSLQKKSAPLTHSIGDQLKITLKK